MPIPSIYIDLEDDVSKIVARIKRKASESVVLVCPKRCFLFNDSINLRLLKKQTDMLGKKVYILTMDERGQMYAKEAGFELKFLPGNKKSSGLSDIRPAKSPKREALVEKLPAKPEESAIASTVLQVKNIVKSLSPKVSPPKIEVKDNVYPRGKTRAAKPSTGHPKLITGLVAVSLLLIVFVVFVLLPNAKVVVYPRTEPVTRDFPGITLSATVHETDIDKLILPATKVEETQELSDNFTSQGKQEVGNKASGQVYIYNFTKSPLNLKAGTTVLTVGSKSYNLVQDLSGIKPTAYKNTKTKEVDETTLGGPYDVVAVSGGDSSNLPAGTRMEITNQVFGSKPLFLFAKTATAITGGTTRYLSTVAPQDITSAQAALSSRILSQLRDKLSSQSLVMPEKAFVMEPVSFTTDKPSGTESPNFQATLKVKITGLAFNGHDLQTLVSARIGQTLSANKTLDISKDNLNYTVKTIDLANQTGVLTVHYEGNAMYNIDLGDVARDLVGKSQTQVNEILRSRAEIQQVDINLAPSWQKSFPWFAGKIKVEVAK